MSLTSLALEKNSLFGVSQKTGLDYVLNINPDRLLAPCYVNTSQISPAKNYGGWENMKIQGHGLGHYISALAGFVKSTGSSEALEKLNYVIGKIKTLQRKDGFFAGIPSAPFEKVFTGNFTVERFNLADWWVPWYSIHKVYAGLIDAYLFCRNNDALDIVIKMADWAEKGLSNLTEEQFQKMLICEHGGMCKVYADLYKITGEKKYLVMAEKFIHKEIVEPLINKQDKLQGYHANTQIPKILGLCSLYEATGKTEYKTAAEFFFNTVTQKRSYAIGGNSISEHFGPEYSELLGKETCETCNTYNMCELAEHIFQWNKNSSTADFYETALYNHILASQAPDTGAKTYFVSMLPGFFKVYCTQENAWWCCTGTGLENPARYNRFIAFDFDDTVYINLFIPCTFSTQSGWTYRIKTEFPYNSKVELTVLKSGSGNPSVKIRNPGWLKKETSSAQDWICLESPLEENKTYTFDFPMKLNIRETSDGSGNFNILYGPIVLAADLGNSGMPLDTVDNHLVYNNLPVEKAPEISGSKNVLSEWITQTSSLQFKTSSECSSDKKSYVLKPFFETHHTRYITYFNSKYPELDKSPYKNSTVDKINLGLQQSEIEHQYKNNGSKSSFSSEFNTAGRTLETGNSITYTLKADAKRYCKLAVAFIPKENASICITVNNSPIKVAAFPEKENQGITWKEADLPAGEENVTVTLTSENSPFITELRTFVKV
ncbi:MAG: glycoside hydrolase family 127 protein [Treponema sp.]|nr:glycoside hydrolase family 127 protein [Treponema sp.]